MAATTHVSEARLEYFANGRLPPTACESILNHLADCDQCLTVMDVLWTSQPENAAVALPLPIAKRLERTLRQRIRNTHSQYN